MSLQKYTKQQRNKVNRRYEYNINASYCRKLISSNMKTQGLINKF